MRTVRLSILLLFSQSLFYTTNSQEVKINRGDILLSGGISVEYVSNPELNSMILRGDALAELEVFILNQFSIGARFDYTISRSYSKTSNPLIYSGDYYTSLILNYYTKKYYYLKAALTLHKMPESTWNYPNSFTELGYGIALGKQIFINNHVIFNLGLDISLWSGNWLNEFGIKRNRTTYQISFNTGLLLIIHPKTKSSLFLR